MEFTIIKEENNYILDIKIPKGVVDREMREMAEGIQPRAQIKGFRKGKVPLNVVQSTYHKEIKAEVSTKLLYSSVSEALQKEKIRNTSNPTLFESHRPTATRQHVGLFGLDGSLKFKVMVDSPPEIELKNYEGIEVEINSSSFEGWAEKELFKQQVAFGDKEEVQRACEAGDEIVADFCGKMDGEEFEGGTHEDYMFVVGSGAFLPGFEEGFLNRKVGEEFTIQLDFPENYPQPMLSGKSVDFECKLKEVYEVTPHPLDETLAMMLSYESVSDMMDKYQEMWEIEFEKPLRSEMFNSIMDVIIEDNPFQPPQNWIEQEMKLTMARMGIQEEQVKDNEEVMKSIRDISDRSVRISFLLDKVYELEESLHLSAEEIESIADKDGNPHGLAGLEYLSVLKNRNQYEAFISFQEQQKTIDFLISKAKIKEQVNE